MKKKLIYPLIIMCFLITLVSGCKKKDDKDSSPITSKVMTTLDRTIVPDAIPSSSPIIKPSDIALFAQYGYGKWHYGPGLPSEKRYDLMPAGYSNTTTTISANLLRFFVITDIHLTDKESPTQVIYFGSNAPNLISAYSPIMLYTTHFLNATVQTINALHKENKFDFGLSLGDDCNNTQFNELRWFIDILDGKLINPDSGEKDDPNPGTGNDYQDEFQATGLDKSIPWYEAMGNHDHFWMGIKPPTDYIRQAYTSTEGIKMGNIFAPGGIEGRNLYMGILDGSTIYGNIIDTGVVVNSPVPAPIVADVNRRSLLRGEWINEFFNTTTSPTGHGFSQANASNGFACYTFEPNPNIPIRVLVLDDTQRDDDVSEDIYGHSSLDMERYNWLVSELDKGQSDGKLLIIAAHVPIGLELGAGNELSWYTNAPVDEATVLAKLHTYPNLILWVAGHRHVNNVTALRSPDPLHPEFGFWEIETASLREFPQQFRTFDIVRNSDNTISIITTDVDPEVTDGSFAALSRSYAIAANKLYNINWPLLPTGSVSYNAELIKQITPTMQNKMKDCGTPVNQSLFIR